MFLTHSSANLVINQSRVARSCSLAPSLSLPWSLQALAPLVCSPALPVCAFLIGFGLELVSSGCPQHRFHTASFGCGEGRSWRRRRPTCLRLSGHVPGPACVPYGYFCTRGALRGSGGGYGDGAAEQAGSSSPTAGCGHRLPRRFPTPSAPCFVPRNPDGRARVGGCRHTGCAGGRPPPQVQNIFCALTSVAQGRPPCLSNPARKLKSGQEPHKGVFLCLCCVLALGAATESRLRSLSHTQTSQICKPVGMAQKT